VVVAGEGGGGKLMQASHSGEPRGRLLCGWVRLVRRDGFGEEDADDLEFVGVSWSMIGELSGHLLLER
jgi:hypothetical protein